MTSPHRCRSVLAIAMITGLALVAPPAFAQGSGMAGGADHRGMQGSMKPGMAGGPMHDMMMRHADMMRSMSMTGDTDRDFATMMRMHHQGGIDMTEVQIRDGKDPELKALAQKIRDGQRRELQELDDWLAKRKR